MVKRPRALLSTREIAKLLGISHTMVQKIERRAMRKLLKLISPEWRP